MDSYNRTFLAAAPDLAKAMLILSMALAPRLLLSFVPSSLIMSSSRCEKGILGSMELASDGSGYYGSFVHSVNAVLLSLISTPWTLLDSRHQFVESTPCATSTLRMICHLSSGREIHLVFHCVGQIIQAKNVAFHVQSGSVAYASDAPHLAR